MAEKKSQASSQEQKESRPKASSQTNSKNIFDTLNMKTQTEVNNANKTELVSQEVRANLSEEELAALELQEAELRGDSVGTKQYKLSRSNTQYTDSENGWTLTGDEAKPLPEFPSSETLERIKAGFIVEATGMAQGAQANTQEEQPAEVRKTPKGE